MTLVSVVIPMFQSEWTIGETLRSSQVDLDTSRRTAGVGGVEGGIDAEIVVVDDGSTDGGPEIARAMASGDARIRVVTRANGGLSAARNTGVHAARGRFVRLLDADDWALPGSTARLVALALRREREGQSPAACGTYDLRDDAGSSMKRSIAPRAGADGCVGIEQLLEANAIGSGAAVVERALLLRHPFDQTLRACEDWDVWLRLAQNEGVRWGIVPGPSVKAYRVRAQSMSASGSLMLTTALGVLERGIARAEGSVDRATLQSTRARARWSLAIGNASVAAATGEIELALAMVHETIERGPERECLSESAGTGLADAALWGVIRGLGVCPEEPGETRARWAESIGRFWDGLIEHGWADREMIEGAWQRLTRLMVGRERVLDAVLDAITGSAGVVLVGAGRNGASLAQRLVTSGVPITARDDRWERADRAETHWSVECDDRQVSVKTESMRAPVQAGWSVVVTPENDRKLAGRVRSAGRVVRWSDVLDRCAISERDSLECDRRTFGVDGSLRASQETLIERVVVGVIGESRRSA